MVKKRIRGRPKKAAPRIRQKQVRWNDEEWSLVAAAAERAGTSPSSFIRDTILEIVRQNRQENKI